MIRPGRDADAEAYIALIGACWSEYPGVVVEVEREIPEIRALASALAAQGGALWVAEHDGRIVGMVAASPADDGWHLSRMYVAAGQRGTGLATTLLEGAEAQARAAGARRMVLWSDLLFERAHSFYENHGYVRRGGLRALQDLSDTIEVRFEKPLHGVVAEALDVAAAQSAERGFRRLGGPTVDWRGVTKRVGEGWAAAFAGWAEGALSGAVWLSLAPEGHRAELHCLIVASAQRRRGVGRALVHAAEAWAGAAGRSLLLAYVPARGSAEAFLRGQAWDAVGVVPGYLAAGGAAQLMCRRLDSGPAGLRPQS